MVSRSLKAVKWSDPKSVRVKRAKTPTATKRKPGTKKRSSRLPGETMMSKALRVYKNPFANVGMEAKIPDGKVTQSISWNSQLVKEAVLENNDNVGTDGIIHMLLFPGQDCCLISQNDNNYTEKVGAFQAAGLERVAYAYDFAGGAGATNNVDGGITVNTANIVAGTQVPCELSSQWANWRVISTGLRLSLLNPQEEDDGWWEACRLKLPTDTELNTLQTVGFTAEGDKYCIAPAGVLQLYKNIGIANEVTYSTGLLRDLHKHEFVLHPVGNEHDFVQPALNHTLPVGYGTNSLNDGSRSLYYDDDKLNFERLTNQYIDPNYDMIYIRLHCRNPIAPAQGAVGFNPSRFLVNAHQNIEAVCTAASAFGRFQTPNKRHPQINRHMVAMRDDHAPHRRRLP